jgi:ATP-binding cassette subfamily F protein 3
VAAAYPSFIALGYLVDDAAQDEDALLVAKSIIDSVTKGRENSAKALVERLEEILHDFWVDRQHSQESKLVKLDKVLEISKTGAMSNTIAFSEGVDLESINKSKYAPPCLITDSQTFIAGLPVWMLRS